MAKDTCGATAPVADIRRLTIHDGPGIRDTVFLKGCPLRCLWCHNPECFEARPRLLFHENLCLGCGACARACPNGVHVFAGGRHALDRARCTACGACARACLKDALAISGCPMDAEEAFRAVMRDRAFFGRDGGVTVSGGEPLLWPAFVRALFRRLRESGVRTALDTCGEVPFSAFEAVLPFADLVLFDLKGMDGARHRANTGAGNGRIHANLLALGALGVPVEIRMPVVPGFNDAPSEFEAAGDLLARVPSVAKVRLLPYHAPGRKFAAAGLPYALAGAAPPPPAALAGHADVLRRRLPGVEVVVNG